jgi:hypothetical protein
LEPWVLSVGLSVLPLEPWVLSLEPWVLLLEQARGKGLVLE